MCRYSKEEGINQNGKQEVRDEFFTPKHQFVKSPYCSFYISQGANKEDWINNEEFFWFMIISYILVTSMFVSGVIM